MSIIGHMLYVSAISAGYVVICAVVYGLVHVLASALGGWIIRRLQK